MQDPEDPVVGLTRSKAFDKSARRVQAACVLSRMFLDARKQPFEVLLNIDMNSFEKDACF